jgi:heavy metal translocating P-type ATPase
VALVRTAQASKSPLQRLADRYAVWFTPLTLAVCVASWWLARDPLRVLAVLVVATPCPLILATPVAVIGGINRAAKRSIIFRNGEALEQLGSVTVAVFDKTGTLTIGKPAVAQVVALPPHDMRGLLRLAGAVEQGSGHLLARTVVEAALGTGETLEEAQDIVEAPGQGVSGRTGAGLITVGAYGFVVSRHPEAAAGLAGFQNGRHGLRAYVAVEGHAAGMIEFADQLRPDLAGFFGRLRELGIDRTVLLTGDHPANAAAVAQAAGISEVHSDLLPGDKVEVVNRLRKAGLKVLMVGDGTNDAPALSSATVGVALAAHGGGITAEAADIVVLADDLFRVTDAITISRRSLRIARQSIWAGLGLSALAMAVASVGYIPPTVGALLQEVIDVAVILNALRTSRA